MLLTICPSKRSSKISFQTSPGVRHQFRRKLRQLHSGNRWCLTSLYNAPCFCTLLLFSSVFWRLFAAWSLQRKVSLQFHLVRLETNSSRDSNMKVPRVTLQSHSAHFVVTLPVPLESFSRGSLGFCVPSWSKVLQIRKLEKAVAVSGICSGVPEENSGENRGKIAGKFSRIAKCFKF